MTQPGRADSTASRNTRQGSGSRAVQRGATQPGTPMGCKGPGAELCLECWRNRRRPTWLEQSEREGGGEGLVGSHHAKVGAQEGWGQRGSQLWLWGAFGDPLERLAFCTGFSVFLGCQDWAVAFQISGLQCEGPIWESSPGSIGVSTRLLRVVCAHSSSHKEGTLCCCPQLPCTGLPLCLRKWPQGGQSPPRTVEIPTGHPAPSPLETALRSQRCCCFPASGRGQAPGASWRRWHRCILPFP